MFFNFGSGYTFKLYKEVTRLDFLFLRSNNEVKMEYIANRLKRVAQSATLVMAQKSREMVAAGVDVINLSIGEPDFDTPDYIKNAAKDAIDANFTHYTPIPGLLSLREAICLKLKRDNDLDYSVDQIVVSNGAKQSICNLLLALLSPGDEVIVPAPYWVSYCEMVKLAEAEPIVIKAGIEQDFKITPAQLEASININTKLFLFSSPSNPTGSIYTSDELLALAEVFKKYPDILILSDEIYELINFGAPHVSMAQIEWMKERVVVINGVSKGYAMTGWRIGFVAAPLWVAKACNKLQGQYTSGAGAVSQKAAEAAFLGSLDASNAMRDIFQNRRDLVVTLVKEIKGVKVSVPQGAFYLLPDISYYFGTSYKQYTVNNASDLCLYILEEGNVATVTGDAFGAPECIRFSFATSEEMLEKAIGRIKRVLLQLE